jgi:membrane protease YdiL (CAAX protease family)
MVLIAIGVAAIFWFFLFSPWPDLAATIHHHYFWPAMTTATVVLSVISIVAQRGEWKRLLAFSWRYVGVGVAHATVLYVLSRIGVVVIVWLLGPWASTQLHAIYQTREQAPAALIAVLLLFLIGPSEEIFWRGFLQDRFMKKFGARNGFLLAAALYMGVHIWAMNPLLLLAALVLGAHWGFLFRRFGSIVPGLISHALWDTTIFVLLPIQV